MTFDKRGTGMSDRVAELPGLDQRMDDLRAVMDAAGMEQAALLGISEGAPLCVLFAATYPDRCRALVLYDSFSRFSYGSRPKKPSRRSSAMSKRPGVLAEACKDLRLRAQMTLSAAAANRVASGIPAVFPDHESR